MKRLFRIAITTVLVIIMALTTVSCNKKVKKIVVDNQFAISIFNDTIPLREILNDMDSTTNSWLRVRNDSVFVYYADSVNLVLSARDLLSHIDDVNFTTSTTFTMPELVADHNHDTVITVDKFATIPFHYDDFVIEEVEMRSGLLSFAFDVNPMIESLKGLEIFSNQLLTADGNPLVLIIDTGRPSVEVNLANFRVIPQNDTVAFGARINLHIENGTYLGGTYNSSLAGSLTNVGFKTVYAIVNRTLDSVYADQTAIDYGVNGLSGSAFLPIPKVNITYRNTFGLAARADVSLLQFVNGATGLVTDLLETDHLNIDILPTNGEYRHFTVEGFTDQIDALAGYTRLDFDGRMTMAMPGEHISISDTSSVDIIADIEMPMSFKITDLRYLDTIDVDFGRDVSIDDYFDEIKFFIDYNNQIPLQVMMQGVFLQNEMAVDSLFDAGGSILYDESSTLSCVITGRKLQNMMKANKMALRLGVNTEFQTDPVMIRESQTLALRLKILTKTTEINIGGEH